RIQDAVPVTLHRHVCHLLLGGAVLLHVGPCDEGEHPGEGQAHRLLVGGVGTIGEVLGGRVGGNVQHALRPAHEDDVGDAGADLHQGVTEGDVAGGAGVLDARGGNDGKAEESGGGRACGGVFLAFGPGDGSGVEGLDCRRGG